MATNITNISPIYVSVSLMSTQNSLENRFIPKRHPQQPGPDWDRVFDGVNAGLEALDRLAKSKEHDDA